MANQCNTNIFLFGAEEDLKKLQKAVEEMGGHPTIQEIADKFGVEDGQPWEDINGTQRTAELTRGYISELYFAPARECGLGTHLAMSIESDYRPCLDILDVLLNGTELLNNLRYLYFAQEKGDALYETNDMFGHIYDVDYIADIHICGTDRLNSELKDFICLELEDPEMTEAVLQDMLGTFFNEPALPVPKLLEKLATYPLKDKYSHIDFIKVDKVSRPGMASKYENKVRELLKEKPIPYVVGCIYGLYQDYDIDEEEEIYLYQIADPNSEYNYVSQYWEDIEEDNPLAA